LSEIVVVADIDVAPGFELAGVEVRSSASAGETEKLLRAMISKGQYGMIIVAEELMGDLSARSREAFEKLTVPLVISIPMPVSPGPEELGRKFVSDMVRQAIGYQIRI